MVSPEFISTRRDGQTFDVNIKMRATARGELQPFVESIGRYRMGD